jgi:hypothetical protein
LITSTASIRAGFSLLAMDRQREAETELQHGPGIHSSVWETIYASPEQNLIHLPSRFDSQDGVTVMRCKISAAAIAVALLAASTLPASAFDHCHGSISADGKVKIGRDAAMSSARWAWRKATWKKHGPRYTDWWYSADRSIDCWWDGPGVKWWCTARARPCTKI